MSVGASGGVGAGDVSVGVGSDVCGDGVGDVCAGGIV